MKSTNALAALVTAAGISALSLAGLLAVLMPSCALAKFGPPITLSQAGQHAINPDVAMNAAGAAVIVWQRTDENQRFVRRVQARSRSAAGTFGPVQTLSVAGSSAVNPQVAIDGEGDAVIVWETSGRTIQLRTRSRTGAFGPIQTVGKPGHRPQVATDADGDSVVIWANFQDDVLQARRLSRAGVLGPILTISAAGVFLELPQLALDPDGDALIVWQESGSPDRILARALARTGLLGPIQRLSGDRDAGSPEVAMDRDGNALVVWANSDGSSKPVDWIQSRARSNAGALGPSQTLIANQNILFDPEIAMDADGDALVVWSNQVANDFLVQARARSRAGVYGGIATLSATGRDALYPQVEMDGDGDAVIVWQRNLFRDRFVAGRTRSKAGVYGPGQTLSALDPFHDAFQNYGEQPRVAMSGNGAALVVWARHDGTNWRIQAAVGP